MSDPGPCGCPQALALQALLVEALEFIDHRELCQERERDEWQVAHGALVLQHIEEVGAYRAQLAALVAARDKNFDRCEAAEREVERLKAERAEGVPRQWPPAAELHCDRHGAYYDGRVGCPPCLLARAEAAEEVLRTRRDRYSEAATRAEAAEREVNRLRALAGSLATAVAELDPHGYETADLVTTARAALGDPPSAPHPLQAVTGFAISWWFLLRRAP